MRNYRIHLIRNGRTQGNNEGLYIGKTDWPLSEEGEQELCTFADTLYYPPAELAYCAAQQRAIRSSAILYEGLEQIAVPELNELNFGGFEQKSPQQLETDEAYRSWLAGGTLGAPPDGESAKEFAARVHSGFIAVVEDLFRRKVFSASLCCSGSAMLSIILQFSKTHGGDLFRWMTEP